MALVNVHPDYMDFGGRGNGSEYAAQLYADFVRYVTDAYHDTCWFALPRDVATHVRQNRRAG
jgi:hypothetical protein